jgi:hypothetical protein
MRIEPTQEIGLGDGELGLDPDLNGLDVTESPITRFESIGVPDVDTTVTPSREGRKCWTAAPA